MRKWAIWIPVLMVASLLYWTVALGLGGLSLVVVSSFDGSDTDASDAEAADVAGTHKDSYEPITVNLVESADPVDVQGSSSGGNTEQSQGPGATAF